MEKEELLYLVFKNSVLRSGGEKYIPVSLALNFIEECKNNKLAIIGIDGFIIVDSKITPLLEHIADFSIVLRSKEDWEQKVINCYELSIKFLEEMINLDNGFLSFVLANKNE